MNAWVSVDLLGQPQEVFDSQALAIEALLDNLGLRLVQMPRAEAVGSVRREIFVRQKARCIACDEVFTEEQMHMHEKHSRGTFVKGRSGNISLDNSEGLCFSCHLGPNGEHGDRRPKFGG